LDPTGEIHIFYDSQAIDVLHGILRKATYYETLLSLEDRFEDQHFAPLFTAN
jgi:hypothetical protein